MTSPPDDVDFLTVHDELQIADSVLPQVIVGDVGLLESAVARPMTFVFGTDAYPELLRRRRPSCTRWRETTLCWTGTSD